MMREKLQKIQVKCDLKHLFHASDKGSWLYWHCLGENIRESDVSQFPTGIFKLAAKYRFAVRIYSIKRCSAKKFRMDLQD